MEEKEFTDFSVDAKGFFTSWVDLKIDFVPQVGEEYTIIWDGEEYQVTMEEQEGATWCGIDYYTPGLPENAIHPFGLLFHFRDPILQAIITTSDAPSHTLSIIKSGTMVHKLDKKYLDLPANLATIDDIQDAKDEALDEALEVANSKITYQVNTINLNIKYNYVTFCNGLFFALKRNDGNNPSSLFYSTDGVSWKITNLPTYKWNDITYGNGLFVAIGYGCAGYSTDGINWTFSGTNVFGWTITYANNMFVAIGCSNLDATGTSAAYFSPDGIRWGKTQLPSTFFIQSISYGNGVFIAVGSRSGYSNKNYLYSTDGINWESKSLPTTRYSSAVAYGDSKFILIGYTGAASLYSIDGINWLKCATNLKGQGFYSLIYANGMFITPGSSYIAYSSDGINWEHKDSPNLSINGSSIAYGKNVYIVADSRQTLCSKDLVNWSNQVPQLTMSNISVTQEVSDVVGVTLHTDNFDNPHRVIAEQIGAITSPTTAAIGQVLSVKSVDESGKPTEWETVDQTGGGSGGSGFIVSDTPPEDTSLLWVDPNDNSGESLAMRPLTFTGAVNATYDGSTAISVAIPTDDHINSLINTALGVIENGTY